MFIYYYDEPDDRWPEVLRPLLCSAAGWTAFYAVLAALIIISDRIAMPVYLDLVAGW